MTTTAMDDVDMRPAQKALTGTARVTYTVTVHGQTHTFTANTSVSGSSTQAALALIHPVCADALDWLNAEERRAKKSKPETPTCGLIGRMKAIAEPAPSGTVSVTGTVEIGDAIHECYGEVHTSGSPYQAARAALDAAKDDLWDWAWDRKLDRTEATA